MQISIYNKRIVVSRWTKKVIEERVTGGGGGKKRGKGD